MDFNRAGLLLHIVSISKDYPKLSKLNQAAMAELEDISEGRERQPKLPFAQPGPTPVYPPKSGVAESPTVERKV